MTEIRRSRIGLPRVSRGPLPYKALRGTTTWGLAMICMGNYHRAVTNANAGLLMRGRGVEFAPIWGRRAVRRAVAARRAGAAGRACGGRDGGPLRRRACV